MSFSSMLTFQVLILAQSNLVLDFVTTQLQLARLEALISGFISRYQVLLLLLLSFLLVFHFDIKCLIFRTELVIRISVSCFMHFTFFFFVCEYLGGDDIFIVVRELGNLMKKAGVCCLCELASRYLQGHNNHCYWVNLCSFLWLKVQ